jgi:hypothetical protein
MGVGTVRSKRSKYAVAAIVVFLLYAGIIAIVAVTLPQPPPALGENARGLVLAFSEPAVDDTMAGLNANDYAAFTQHFDDKMKAASTPTQFASLEKTVVGKIGKYVSRRVADVQQSGDMVTVVYTAKFEDDDPVTMTIAFHAAEPHQISGVHFNSAKLQQR